jgi:hypothetical protein
MQVLRKKRQLIRKARNGTLMFKSAQCRDQHIKNTDLKLLANHRPIGNVLAGCRTKAQAPQFSWSMRREGHVPLPLETGPQVGVRVSVPPEC